MISRLICPTDIRTTGAIGEVMVATAAVIRMGVIRAGTGVVGTAAVVVAVVDIEVRSARWQGGDGKRIYRY